MGILISGPSYIYGDNMSVVHNTSKSASVLRKRNNSVCYQTVGKSVTLGESLVEHTLIKENVSYLMIEVLYGQKRKYLVHNIFYDINDDH